MNNHEKMWYSVQEAMEYLGIDERTLSRKMIFFNLETRTLPGLKGQFISKRDVELIKRYLTHPGSVML